MIYREVEPSGRLKPYINCFWMIEDGSGHELHDISFPDGCLELIFNMGAPVERAPDHQHFTTNPTTEVIGQITRPYSIRSRGSRSMLGVRFYPHTAACFLKEEVSAFNDHVIDPSAIFGSRFDHLYQRIAESASLKAKISALENFLLGELVVMGTPYRIVDYAVKSILTYKDKNDLSTILQQCNVSARYLQKLFVAFLGISPKMLIRIVRFQKTFSHLKEAPLTQVAYDCGYFDQSHFIRDFKRLSGLSPTQFLERQQPYNTFFLQDSNRSYLGNFNILQGQQAVPRGLAI